MNGKMGGHPQQRNVRAAPAFTLQSFHYLLDAANRTRDPDLLSYLMEVTVMPRSLIGRIRPHSGIFLTVTGDAFFPQVAPLPPKLLFFQSEVKGRNLQRVNF